jgi:hypothetical protein
MPGDSEPVVALAPNRPNGPQALMTIISEPSIAPRMVSIVISLPLEPEAPVANAAPTLLRILRDLVSRPNLGPVVKECLDLPRDAADIHWRTDDDRIGGQEVVTYHFTDPL